MAKQRNIGLTHNGLLTEEAVKRYIDGSLTDDQQSEFEAILATDPFAQDAIDGMKATASVAESFSSVDEIKAKIRTRTGLTKSKPKAVQIHWSVFAYAAGLIAIVVGIGVVFMFYQGQSNQEMAKAEIASEDTSNITLEANTPLQDTTAIGATTATDSLSTSPLVAVNATSGAAGNAQSEPVVEKPSSITMADNAGAGTVAATPAQATYKDERTAPDRTKTAEASAAPVAVAKKAVAEEKEALPQTEIAQAMSLFTNGDYKNAEAKFNEVLSKSPDNADATYFGGVSTYINGNSAKAEQQFDKLIRKGVYVEGSKWYKANILLKKGKTAEAKELLQSLSNSTGVYRERAIKKLEALQ